MVADAPTSQSLLPSALPLPVGSEGRGVGSCETTPQATPLADQPSSLLTPSPTHPPTPSSSPSPDSLFSLLLLNNLNVEATATQTNIPLSQLLDLLATEQSQKRLATYQQFQLAQVNTRILATTAESRLNAIKQLEELNKSSSNPIEQRRACSLILRYSTPLPLVARPSGPGVLRALNPLRVGSDAASRLLRPGPSAPTESSTPRSLLAEIAAEVLAAESTQPPAPTSEIANPTSESSASPDSSTPLLLHSSTFPTPASLITALTRSLTRKHPTRDARITELLEYFTPNATFNCKPLATDPHQHLEPILSKVLHTESRTLQADDTTHHERLVLIRQRQPCLILRLKLQRQNPTAPWLIAEAMTLLNSS